MSSDVNSPPAGSTGKFVRGPKACGAFGMTFFHARDAKGNQCALITLDEDADQAQREAFDAMVPVGPSGELRLKRPRTDSIVLKSGINGLLAHILSLKWRLPRRIKALVEVARIVEDLHSQERFTGPLTPEAILLDEHLRPILLLPKVVTDGGNYQPPELSDASDPSVASDIYVLGQLLRFVLDQKDPPHEVSELPRLDELMKFPAGVTRIIRKATVANPTNRYHSVAAMIADLEKYGRPDEVGLAHPDVNEQNLGGTSVSPIKKQKPKREARKPQIKPAAVLGASPGGGFSVPPKVRIGLLIGGAVGILATLALTWALGATFLVRALLSLSAAVVGFGVFKCGIQKEAQARVVFAMLVFTATFALNPTPLLAKYKSRNALSAGDLQTRLDNFRRLTAEGVMLFEDLDLSTADLRQDNFMFARLTNVSFEKANLAGTNFMHAKLKKVRFAGADLSGTHFVETTLDGVTDLELAICNDDSVLPKGWDCVEGHPKPRQR